MNKYQETLESETTQKTEYQNRVVWVLPPPSSSMKPERYHLIDWEGK